MKWIPLIILLFLHAAFSTLAQKETNPSPSENISDFLNRLDAFTRGLVKPAPPKETAGAKHSSNPFASSLKKRFGDPEMAAEFANRRANMIRGFSKIAYLQPEVVAAMAAVPMELFCPDATVENVYLDRPIPVWSEETISQASLTAFILSGLAIEPGDKVLELKAASGYQTAILAQMGAQVYAIETDPDLVKIVGFIFKEISLPNLHYKAGNIFVGWPEAGPFDAIVATAAYSRIPPALLNQLKPGGRLIAPVGPPTEQSIVLFSKDARGSIRAQPYMSVAYSMMPGSEPIAPSPANPSPEDAGDIARLILQRFDKDGDDAISKKEFEGPDELFEKVDANGDGKWSLVEILRDIRSRLQENE
ncbi:MAG: hypothetical protein VCA36_08380 [Opitutales bacterium]